MAKIEIEVDIDEVFAQMSIKERKEFMSSNLSEADDSDIKDYAVEHELINLGDFDDDQIVEYLLSKGYTIM